MRVGVVTAIKPQERRVALTPAGAQELVASGHEVLVERTAGGGSRFPDQDFESAGARPSIRERGRWSRSGNATVGIA